MSLAKKISVLNTIVKYFYQGIIEANYNVNQCCNCLIWPSNFYTRCAKSVVRRCLVKKLFLKILQDSQENICPRPSLEILFKRKTSTQMFSSKFPKSLRTPLVAAYANRDATPTCKSLVDVWTSGKVQSRYFGLSVTVTLFSRQQCYRKYVEKKSHESDELAFLFDRSVLQYLRTWKLNFTSIIKVKLCGNENISFS